jgi:TonB-linked SusC/RagA family outer membrane protein
LYDYTDGEYIPILNKAPSSLNRETIQYINTLLQASLNYAGKWNDKHSLSALLLYEESNRKADNFYGRREFSLDAVEQLFAGNTTNQVINSNPDYLFDKANKSLVGRLNYDYASKYLAEFSFRYDGSSLYGPGHQWGFFPSGLVGWRMSEEAFIKNNEKLNFINNLKWRVSYGVMGDENAAMYQYLAGYTYPNSGYVFGTDYINALSSASGANPALSWSKSSIFNAGLDIGLWNGLLGLSADIFQRYRYDLVGQRNATMPNIVGIDLPQENLNSEIIKGVEFVLTHRNKIGNDFTYHFSGNIAFSRSKTDYYERQRSGNSYLDWRGNPNGRWNSIVWGRDYLGQYQSFDEIFNSGVIYEGAKGNSRLFPGDLIYGDWNEDGIIDGNDDHPIALNNADNPLLTYGFTIGVKYRGFDLNTVWQGTGMRWIRYPLWYTIPMEWGRGGLDIFLDRWHRADEFNPDSEWIPGYYPSTYVNNLRGHITQPNSQFWQLNCSYLRLKSLELGYTLPAKITKKTGMENVRLFFNSYNLLTFTKMKFIDPERPDTDLGSAYPNSKTFNIGANVTF